MLFQVLYVHLPRDSDSTFEARAPDNFAEHSTLTISLDNDNTEDSYTG